MHAGGRDIIVSGKAIRTARIDGDGFRFIADPEPLLTDFRDGESRIDLFTFMQRVVDPEPRYRYPMEWDNFAALDIKSFDHWWSKQVGNKTRNMVRQAEKKGVIVREIPFEESLGRGIWEIYNETPIRQGRKFFNYGKTLETVRREAGTFLDCSVFVGAFFQDKLIGFTKLTIDETGTQAGLMHIIALLQHRDKAPTNALIAQTVRACSDRGVPNLVYSNFAYGRKTHDSLSDFKVHNGFRRVDVPRYYIPLSLVGQLARHAGLHLSRHHHLPESVMAAYRKYRAAWYNRRYSVSQGTGDRSKAVMGA
jgi:hypothetical protein